MTGISSDQCLSLGIGNTSRAAPSAPPRVSLGWWTFRRDEAPAGTPVPSPVRAGERWRLTVRLKPPHAGFNPHGFDAELWMFEQGVRATGAVRSGRGAGNERLDDLDVSHLI